MPPKNTACLADLNRRNLYDPPKSTTKANFLLAARPQKNFVDKGEGLIDEAELPPVAPEIEKAKPKKGPSKLSKFFGDLKTDAENLSKWFGGVPKISWMELLVSGAILSAFVFAGCCAAIILTY